MVMSSEKKNRNEKSKNSLLVKRPILLFVNNGVFSQNDIAINFIFWSQNAKKNSFNRVPIDGCPVWIDG